MKEDFGRFRPSRRLLRHRILAAVRYLIQGRIRRNLARQAPTLLLHPDIPLHNRSRGWRCEKPSHTRKIRDRKRRRSVLIIGGRFHLDILRGTSAVPWLPKDPCILGYVGLSRKSGVIHDEAWRRRRRWSGVAPGSGKGKGHRSAGTYDFSVDCGGGICARSTRVEDVHVSCFSRAGWQRQVLRCCVEAYVYASAVPPMPSQT